MAVLESILDGTRHASGPSTEAQPEEYDNSPSQNRMKKKNKDPKQSDKSAKLSSESKVKKTTKKSSKKDESSRKKEKIAEQAELFSDEESDTDLGGSPWDPTERTQLNFEDLDLDKSYVEDYMEARREASEALEEKIEGRRPPRRPKWNYEGEEPLTDITKLIEMGWDTREPDLDPTDVKGQIQRCKERIEENIMPSFFEERLKRLEAEEYALIESQRSERPDLSKYAVARIASLRETESGLRGKREFRSQLVNVQAILAAYRSKTLDWTPGLVTYWSEGQQLSQPRPFSWDEFEAINDACNRSESFWLEGSFGLKNGLARPSLTMPGLPIVDSAIYYNIALRIPGQRWWIELEFMYDTGSADMHIFKADIDLIAGPDRNPVRIIRTERVHGIAAHLDTPIIQLEGTILDANGRRMCPWIRIPAGVNTTDFQQNPPAHGVPGAREHPRLDGGIFRRFFYYMTSPDGENTLKIADTRMSLIPMVRGLKKEDRINLINRQMQYAYEVGVRPTYINPTAIGNDEATRLRARERAPPQEAPGFFNLGR
ncbi:hypothetical protein N7456_011060 [Penicillium angulare]|uniref:Uncharacterized protein n=1 Tax=Penicillium angulare TaxID=116970 RepID=A0A9W9ET83_9EURO|nr:hypothetical protein N7456_011060 [Penicillium angulare]